jgi:hypothetical protein
MSLSTNQINLLGEIYKNLVRKAMESSDGVAGWVDPATGTVWMLDTDDQLIVRYNPDNQRLIDMSEDELTAVINSMQDKDEGVHFL